MNISMQVCKTQKQKRESKQEERDVDNFFLPAAEHLQIYSVPADYSQQYSDGAHCNIFPLELKTEC